MTITLTAEQAVFIGIFVFVTVASLFADFEYYEPISVISTVFTIACISFAFFGVYSAITMLIWRM